MLLGAVAGAATNPDDRLRGALLGGTLGAVTGGLGGAVAPAASGTGSALTGAGTAASKVGAQEAAKAAITKTAAQEAAKQAGLESAKQVAAKEVATEAAKQAATETAKNVAAEEATKQAVTETVKTGGNQVFNAADLGANVNPATSGFNPSIQAPKPTGFENIAEISANATEVKPGLFDSLRGSSVGDVSQNPGVVTNSQIPQSQINQSLQSAPANTGLDFGRAGERFGTAVKENPMETAMFTSQMLGGGQQQQQAAPVYAAPIEQSFNASAPPSIEERLAMTGGNEPSFVPRGLFEEERAVLDDEERLKIMNQQFRVAGLV